MEEEEKKEIDNKQEQEPEQRGEKGFGKIIDALHEKQKLPSLRTYQGDVSEFIKEKNESTISIATKEREAKRERGELEMPKPKSGPGNKPVSLTMLLLSLMLILGGVMASVYIIRAMKEEPAEPVVAEEKILPYGHSLNLANVSRETLSAELRALPFQNGISIVKITDQNGAFIKTALDFFNFLKVSPPSALTRTLQESYAVGAISQSNSQAYFLAIKVSDFGTAFSAMLEWEKNLEKDLTFLRATDIKQNVSTGVSTGVDTSVSTSTATTTVSFEVTPPLIQHIWQWRDLIIKNKDTRALADQYGTSKLAYTFLDKNTILIISDAYAVGEISTAYASRAFTR